MTYYSLPVEETQSSCPTKDKQIGRIFHLNEKHEITAVLMKFFRVSLSASHK